jgi:lipopolysaccharide transport system permease protein
MSNSSALWELGRSEASWRWRATYLWDLLYELVSREVKVQYKRSSLGILWSLANPLFQFLVFGFLFSKVFAMSATRYSTYAFSGLLIWTWFQASLAQGTRAITGNRELIKRPGFPVAVLPVVSVVTPWVHFLWALPVLGLFLWRDAAPLSWSVLLLPGLMLLQFLLSLSLIYMLAAVNVVFRDAQHILGVILQVLLFATPVFYQAKAIPEKYRAIYLLNPLAHLIDAYRAVLVEGTLPNWSVLAVLTAAGLLILLGSFQVFMRISARFADEL